jgi:hypothetical protein
VCVVEFNFLIHTSKLFTHTHTHIYIYIYMCVCVCMYVCMCVRVPSHRQEKQAWSIQKPVGRLDAINTLVIFPGYNVGLYGPRSETRNDT